MLRPKIESHKNVFRRLQSFWKFNLFSQYKIFKKNTTVTVLVLFDKIIIIDTIDLNIHDLIRLLNIYKNKSKASFEKSYNNTTQIKLHS